MLVDKSQASEEVAIINGEAESAAVIIKNQAAITTTNNTINYQSKQYKEAKTGLNFQQSSHLLDYVFYLNLMNLNYDSGTKLIVGMDDTVINMK